MPYKNKSDRVKASIRWRTLNREKYRIIQNNWSAKNRDKKKESALNWMRRNPKKVKNAYLLREYGISHKEYNILVKNQNNLCAICIKEELGKSLAVDHCHKTGKIRGLLCSDCNRAIGMLKDDITILRNAIEYLSK